MTSRPCPICRTPAPREGNPWRPFCSDRCRLRDLGAWSGEGYRIPAKPEEGRDEGWSEASEGPVAD